MFWWKKSRLLVEPHEKIQKTKFFEVHAERVVFITLDWGVVCHIPHLLQLYVLWLYMCACTASKWSQLQNQEESCRSNIFNPSLKFSVHFMVPRFTFRITLHYKVVVHHILSCMLEYKPTAYNKKLKITFFLWKNKDTNVSFPTTTTKSNIRPSSCTAGKNVQRTKNCAS